MNKALIFARIKERCKAEIFCDLIERRVNFDCHDKRGRTPLHYAIQMQCNEDVINLILENTTDLNNKDKHSFETLLHAAVKADCSLDLLRNLVARGASLDDIDIKGCTPLHLAFQCNRDQIVIAFLLEHTTNMESTDAYGYSLLHQALLYSCSLNMLRAMVAKGAPLYVHDKQGRTPLHLAFQLRKGRGVINFLLTKTTEINRTIDNDTGETLLHAALKSNCSIDVFSELVARGASFNDHDKQGYTPLHLVLQLTCKQDVIDLLIKNATKLNPDESLLHVAIKENYSLNLLRNLVVKGASLDILDKQGCTPLHLAFQYNRDQLVIAFLLENTTNMESTDAYGYSLLHQALLYSCSLDMLRAMVAKGAPLDVHDKQGRTPLHLAFQLRKGTGIINFLLKNTAEINSIDNDTVENLLHAAMEMDTYSLDVLRDLVLKGVSLDDQDKGGRTPLHRALQLRRDQDVIDFLIENTANFSSTEYGTGETLLHAAIYGSYSPMIIRLLIDKGVDINDEDTYGNTAFNLMTEPHRLSLLTEIFPDELNELQSIQLSPQTTLYDVLVLHQPHNWNSVDRPLACLTERNKPLWSVILSSIVAQGAYSFCLRSGAVCLEKDSTRVVMQFLEDHDIINVLLAHWPFSREEIDDDLTSLLTLKI